MDHHLIFDELICTKYDRHFLDSLKALKENVKSLWIAMGAVPVTGKQYIKECAILSQKGYEEKRVISTYSQPQFLVRLIPVETIRLYEHRILTIK